MGLMRLLEYDLLNKTNPGSRKKLEYSSGLIKQSFFAMTLVDLCAPIL